MDNELKNFRLNITQLAAITDLHRQTVAGKLANVQPAPGSNPKLKLYALGQGFIHRFRHNGVNLLLRKFLREHGNWTKRGDNRHG